AAPSGRAGPWPAARPPPAGEAHSVEGTPCRSCGTKVRPWRPLTRAATILCSAAPQSADGQVIPVPGDLGEGRLKVAERHQRPDHQPPTLPEEEGTARADDRAAHEHPWEFARITFPGPGKRPADAVRPRGCRALTNAVPFLRVAQSSSTYDPGGCWAV